MNGLDGFQRQIRQLQDNIASLGGEHSATEIFNPRFMRTRTSFPTFEAMCAAAGISTAEEFTAMPDKVWERHVQATTPFESWDAMQQAAGEAWAQARLHDGLR
jgi:hypothetical protein